MPTILPWKVKCVVLLLTILILSAGCDRTSGFPDDARAALEIRIAAISSAQGLVQSPIDVPGVEIIRAWRGSPQPELQDTQTEIWCVEVKTSPLLATSPSLENMIWLVTRQNKGSDWEVSPLLIMSSIWPYQACGLEP